MKKILAVASVVSSFSAFANPMIMKCINTTNTHVTRSAVLCAGVKSDKEIALVQKCFKTVEEANADRSAVLCTGVKSESEMKAVFKCYKDVVADGDRSSILCSGVKKESEIPAIQKCYTDPGLEKLSGDFTAVVCSKSTAGLHLLSEKLVEFKKSEARRADEKVEKE